MDNGLHTVVEFDYNDKWFVLAEQIIEGTKYSFLVKVNDVPLLIPDSKKYIDHPEMLKEFLGDIDAK